MLLDGIISKLAADTGLAVYKNQLPRGFTLPAAVVHRYGGTQENDLQAANQVREDQVQVDVYTRPSDNDEAASESVRRSLSVFSGTLPDGTVVQLSILERYLGMPFLPHADQVGIANRSLLGFRVISSTVG